MHSISGFVMIASPFLLVHGVGHDEQTWIPLFSICYFHHGKDGDMKHSKHQAHLMNGVIIGRLPTSNALLVYNLRNKQYYEPDSYRIDSYPLPCSIYCDLKYDGGLFCSLYPSRNYILLVLESNALTLLLICFWLVLSWTFQFPMLLPPPTPPLLLLCTLYSWYLRFHPSSRYGFNHT